MPTFKLKPAHKDVLVRDPDSLKPLAADGEDKPQTSYWMRRIAEGDVIDIEAQAAQQAADKKAADEAKAEQKKIAKESK